VFSKVYGLPTISLRYFNVFGPQQDPSGAYAAVIPKFIMKIMKQQSPVIYGNGEQSRDFTFIDNIVKANILAAEKTQVTGVFNIACGTRITLNELARQLMDIIDIHVDIKYDDPRPGDIVHSLADISKARALLDYHPSSSIRDGLMETVSWFES
jgi:UDP-glucose 4-epimerase